MGEWEEDFWEEPENQWVATPEPHCRVCAAQRKAIEEEMDVVEEDTFSNIVLPLRPTNRQTFRLRRVSDLTTNFGMDESYAREANEFGY